MPTSPLPRWASSWNRMARKAAGSRRKRTTSPPDRATYHLRTRPKATAVGIASRGFQRKVGARGRPASRHSSPRAAVSSPWPAAGSGRRRRRRTLIAGYIHQTTSAPAATAAMERTDWARMEGTRASRAGKALRFRTMGAYPAARVATTRRQKRRVVRAGRANGSDAGYLNRARRNAVPSRPRSRGHRPPPTGSRTVPSVKEVCTKGQAGLPPAGAPPARRNSRPAAAVDNRRDARARAPGRPGLRLGPHPLPRDRPRAPCRLRLSRVEATVLEVAPANPEPPPVPSPGVRIPTQRRSPARHGPSSWQDTDPLRPPGPRDRVGGARTPRPITAPLPCLPRPAGPALRGAGRGPAGARQGDRPPRHRGPRPGGGVRTGAGSPFPGLGGTARAGGAGLRRGGPGRGLAGRRRQRRLRDQPALPPGGRGGPGAAERSRRPPPLPLHRPGGGQAGPAPDRDQHRRREPVPRLGAAPPAGAPAGPGVGAVHLPGGDGAPPAPPASRAHGGPAADLPRPPGLLPPSPPPGGPDG